MPFILAVYSSCLGSPVPGSFHVCILPVTQASAQMSSPLRGHPANAVLTPPGALDHSVGIIFITLHTT